MKTVELTTHFEADPERIWREVNRPQLLLFVARPLIRFLPIAPQDLPDLWEENDYLFRMWLYGFVPLGQQTISISRPVEEHDLKVLRDNGHSAMVKRWDHSIKVEPDRDGTRYMDRIEIDAGVFTPVVATFARVFYAHRQRRWLQLIASNFDYTQA